MSHANQNSSTGVLRQALFVMNAIEKTQQPGGLLPVNDPETKVINERINACGNNYILPPDTYLAKQQKIALNAIRTSLIKNRHSDTIEDDVKQDMRKVWNYPGYNVVEIFTETMRITRKLMSAAQTAAEAKEEQKSELPTNTFKAFALAS